MPSAFFSSSAISRSAPTPTPCSWACSRSSWIFCSSSSTGFSNSSQTVTRLPPSCPALAPAHAAARHAFLQPRDEPVLRTDAEAPRAHGHARVVRLDDVQHHVRLAGVGREYLVHAADALLGQLLGLDLDVQHELVLLARALPRLDLAQEQLDAAVVAHLDAARGDDDGIGDERLARLLVGLREHGALDAPGEVFERDDAHELAGARRELPDLAHQPHHAHLGAVALLERARDAVRGHPLDVAAQVLERVLGEVEPEHLLLARAAIAAA